MPISSLRNAVAVELIYEGFKYVLQVAKMGPTSYFIVLNDSHVTVEAHRLTDGGLLMSLDGSSHTTYMKEEVSGYRIVIGNKTCVFQKENDPSVLRSGRAASFLSLACRV